MRGILRGFAASSALLLMTACADSHQLMNPYGYGSLSLDASDDIYISVPQDGFYGSRDYAGSGETTTNIIKGSFLRYSNNVDYAHSVQSMKDSLIAAKKSGADYLVFPTILHWEDRATEWSIQPDKVEVKIQVIDVSTGETEASVIAKGKSGLATLGGDHPQDLLPKPIERFVSTIYY